MQKKFKDWPSSQPLTKPNSCDPWHSQQGGSNARKPSTVVSLSLFSLLFSLLHQPEREHKPESNSVTSWAPSPWKASSCRTTLRKVDAISPHRHQFQTCLCINWQNKQVSITHNAGLPYPPPGNINQCSTWADWSHISNKTEKQIANYN
jgi:hypothetical protein